MKLIAVMVLFSSLLFGMQKQIVVGSYSIESNAIATAKKLQYKLDNNAKLKKYAGAYALKVESKRVGDYTVVSLNVFDSYPALFQVINEVKRYYKDAYSLPYRLDNGSIAPSSTRTDVSQQVVEKTQAPEKSVEEQVVATAPAMMEEEIQEVLEEDILGEVAVNDITEEDILASEEIEQLEIEEEEELNNLESQLAGDELMMDEDTNLEESGSGQYNYYFYILAVIALFFIVVGVIINKKYKTKSGDNEE